MDSDAHLHEAQIHLNEALKSLNAAGTSRELSLARTKVEEAKMWAREHRTKKDTVNATRP